jgi:hypothetical protein
MFNNCNECEQLWREYGAATARHIDVENTLRLAAIKGDCDRVIQLAPKAETAHKARIKCRERIGQHETTQHAEAGENAIGYHAAAAVHAPLPEFA